MALSIVLGAQPNRRPSCRNEVNGSPTWQIGLEASTYSQLLAANGAEAAASTAYDFLEQHLERLSPKDPIERMLAIQLLWQHTRIASLCVRETRTADPKLAAALRAAIEQAMNTFRRQAKALRDLQSPRAMNLIQGRQVNVGDGQIVANTQVHAAGKSANKLGCRNGDEACGRIPHQIGRERQWQRIDHQAPNEAAGMPRRLTDQMSFPKRCHDSSSSAPRPDRRPPESPLPGHSPDGDHRPPDPQDHKPIDYRYVLEMRPRDRRRTLNDGLTRSCEDLIEGRPRFAQRHYGTLPRRNDPNQNRGERRSNTLCRRAIDRSPRPQPDGRTHAMSHGRPAVFQAHQSRR